MSVLGNRFPFIDRTSQTRLKEKTFGAISVLIPYYFYASLVAYFCFCPSGGRWRVFMSFLHVALALKLNALLYSFIHVSTFDYDKEM